MNLRRELAMSVFACVLGAALALLTASRTWAVRVRAQPSPLPPLHIAHTGTAEVPWLSALALVALAGAAVLLGTRGGARSLVGVFVLLAGLGVLAGGGYGLLGVAGARPVWPLLCLPAGALVAGGGLLAVLHGRDWPAMGARYERPRPASNACQADPGEDRVQRAGPSPSNIAMWDALDRGEDPSR
jgi:hypothetical protein